MSSIPNASPCSICGAATHHSENCPQLSSPLKKGFSSDKQGGGGGGHDDDDDDEKVSSSVSLYKSWYNIMYKKIPV